MQDHNLKSILPSVDSFEEYENLKINIEILKNAAKEIIARHHLPDAPLVLFADGTNIVFAYGNDKVIKIFPPFHQDQFKSESLVLKAFQGKLSIKTPEIEYEGEIDSWPYIIISRLEGTLLETLWEKMDNNQKIILIRELGTLIREIHALPTKGLEAIDCHWESFITRQIHQCVAQHRSKNLPESLIQQIPTYLSATTRSLPLIRPAVILTGEYTPMNILVKQTTGIWHIEGMIDFGDAMLGMPEYDLLGPGAFLIQGDKSLLRTFLMAYGYSSEALTPKLSQQLNTLMLLHRYSNLEVQIRIKDWKNKINSLEDLESLVWGL